MKLIYIAGKYTGEKAIDVTHNVAAARDLAVQLVRAVPGVFPVAWARSVVAQCKAAGVPVFVKQLGARPQTSYYDAALRDMYDAAGWEWPDPIGWQECDGQPRLNTKIEVRLRDRKGGNPAEWPEDLRVREWPEARP